MKKTGFTFLILIWFVASKAQTTTLTLKQCIDTAIANNLQVLQGNLLLREAAVNLRQAKMDRLPNLTGSATYGSNQGRSIDPFSNAFINQQVSYSAFGVSSGVILFNGLSMQNRVKQNQLAKEAEEMDWQQTKDNLTLNVILAFLQVLNNEDQVLQSKNQVGFSNKQVERLQVLNNEGAIAPSLLYDLRGQVANDELSTTANEKALERSKIYLCELLNIPYDKNIKLERVNENALTEILVDNPMEVYQKAQQQLAILKAAALRKESARKAVLVAKGRLFPTLSLGANLNTNYSSAALQNIFVNKTTQASSDYVIVNGNQTPVMREVTNFNTRKINYFDQLNNNLFTGVNLTLSVPIFNGLQARNRIRLAEINFENNVLLEKTAKTNLQRDVEQAFINLQAALKNYKTLQEQVSAYDESFRAAEIRFNAGVGNSIDYLTAKNNIDRANTNLISAKFDVILRRKILDYYKGNALW